MKRIITFILICSCFLWGCEDISENHLSEKASSQNGFLADSLSYNNNSDNNNSDNNNSDNDISYNNILNNSSSYNNISDKNLSNNSSSNNNTLNKLEELEELEELSIEVSYNEAEKIETVSFSRLPKSLKDLENLEEDYYKDPRTVAALHLASLCEYEENPAECINMINYLKITEKLTDYELQMYENGLKNKNYKPYSYFAGAMPENYYKADEPYTIYIYEDKYSWLSDTYVKLYIYSSGAEYKRPITLEFDENSGRWRSFEDGLLADIKLSN